MDSLIGAVMRADADALVMHVGEKPYLVGAAEAAELSSRTLTPEALTAMIDQVLPADSRRALCEVGAVEYDLPRAGSERLTMVAARGGDDIWVEIRRHRGIAAAPHGAAPGEHAPGADAPPAVVLPLTRATFRKDAGVHVSTAPRTVSLDRLLKLAVTRRATALYVNTDASPSIRVEGAICALETERVLAATDVAELMIDPSPDRMPHAISGASGSATNGRVTTNRQVGAELAAPREWVRDLPDIGRVRCMGFRDHRGPGAVFHLASPQPASPDHLGLSRDILALCAEPAGLIVVAGRRGSGKSTLISALVDEINRTRSARVVVLERETEFVHQDRRSLVSQREVRGGDEDWIAAARGALNEDADVLVLGAVTSAALAEIALEAADSGRLVIAAVAAPDAAGAIGRLVQRFPRDRRDTLRSMLAGLLRGVIAQVLLPKAGGGRVAARELLLNTPAVHNLIAEGNLSDLPAALASGRKDGMVPLNDALAAFVQSGAVDVAEAWRLAFDREGLRASLARGGVDLSFVERLA